MKNIVLKNGYPTGQAFYEDLRITYGKEEGIAKAKRYLELQKNTFSESEKQFCAELLEAIKK